MTKLLKYVDFSGSEYSLALILKFALIEQACYAYLPEIYIYFKMGNLNLLKPTYLLSCCLALKTPHLSSAASGRASALKPLTDVPSLTIAMSLGNSFALKMYCDWSRSYFSGQVLSTLCCDIGTLHSRQ